MTKPTTPFGADDPVAGTKGPTATDDPRKFGGHSSPPGPIHGGEEKKPGEMPPELRNPQDKPRLTGRDGEQEA